MAQEISLREPGPFNPDGHDTYVIQGFAGRLAGSNQVVHNEIRMALPGPTTFVFGGGETGRLLGCLRQYLLPKRPLLS